MMIFLNPNAGGGTALVKWRHLCRVLPASNEPVKFSVLKDRRSMASQLNEAVACGERHFVAAGGDGTVNEVLNALMKVPLPQREQLVLGSIGLGSSNDFHKPIGASSLLDGNPSKVDFRHYAPRDVGAVTVHTNGNNATKYFVINASVGITAEGNAFFNGPDRLLRWLKVHNTGGAILYAALHALFLHRNQTFVLELPCCRRINIELTNLGVVKSPHFSGSLRYDVPLVFDDGYFRLFAAVGMGYLQRMRLLISLSRGMFPRTPQTQRWSVPSFSIQSATPFPLEIDGEIVHTQRAEFTVLRRALKVCI